MACGADAGNVISVAPHKHDRRHVQIRKTSASWRSPPPSHAHTPPPPRAKKRLMYSQISASINSQDRLTAIFYISWWVFLEPHGHGSDLNFHSNTSGSSDRLRVLSDSGTNPVFDTLELVTDGRQPIHDLYRRFGCNLARIACGLWCEGFLGIDRDRSRCLEVAAWRVIGRTTYKVYPLRACPQP